MCLITQLDVVFLPVSRKFIVICFMQLVDVCQDLFFLEAKLLNNSLYMSVRQSITQSRGGGVIFFAAIKETRLTFCEINKHMVRRFVSLLAKYKPLNKYK